MPSETRRISDEEWERHKTRILELYRERRLQGTDGVLEMMEKEGFVATPSQYELRFRKWGTSKNVKQRDWERRINGTPSSGEVPQTITTISESRQRRAQRRYRLGRSHGDQRVLRGHSSTARTEDLPRPITEASEGPQYLNSQNRGLPVEAASNPNLGLQRLDNDSEVAHGASGSPNLGHAPHRLESLDQFSPLVGSPYYLGLIADIVGSPSLDHHNDLFELQLSGVGQLCPANSRPRCGWVKPSPSNELISRILKGIHLKWSSTKTSDPNLLFKFTNALNGSIRSSANLATLPNFDILRSRDAFAGENWNQLSHLSDDAGREACLDGRLIASIVNNFAGLEDLPAAGVLEFLNRHSNMQQVVIEFLHNQSSPIAKAFAESLLLASLEADNVSIVQYLLGGKLVDATTTVYRHNGFHYTVFEIAIIKRFYEVIEFFVNRNPDLCHHRGCDGNALELLIAEMRHDDRESTFEDRFLRLVDVLLEQGCTVTEGTISWALVAFTDTRIGTSLAQDLASKAPHQLLMNGDLVSKIVKNLDEDDAMKIINPAVDICQPSDEFRRFFRLSSHIEDALGSCMKRGHDKLSRILLPYASNPSRTLSDAMEAGNQILVDVIMHHNPDLYQSQIMDTTAFIAALRSGDENHLGLVEQGVFNHLRGRILGHALTAALEAGSLQYATKLLELDPDFEFVSEDFDVTTALDYALAHDFSSIAWKLLTAGVIICEMSRVLILKIAMRREKADFVKAMMEFNFDAGRWEDHEQMLEESALTCNDDTIFTDVWAALPAHFTTPESIFLLTLRKGRRELFLQMFECSLSGISQQNALLAAVAYEDPSLLNDLVSLGAKADDEKALEQAVQNHSSMVEPLLEHYWKAYPRGRPGYGHSAILKALERYPESPQILDSLLRWNLVGSTNDAHGDYFREALIFKAAVRTRSYDIVKKFIRRGADIDVEMSDHSGKGYSTTTALLEAVFTGSLDIVRLLLDHGADVNKPARFGIRRTPLQKAAEVDDIAIVRLLLDHGADVNAAPGIFVGATALQLAAINGNCEMATILIEHGARHDVPPPIGLYGRWPLEGAAEKGRFDMIQLLWDADQGYFEDERCCRAMQLAERDGHIGCKELVAELMARKSSTHLHTLRVQTPRLP